MERIDVSISKPMKDWMHMQIQAGHYPNEEVYIEELIRRDQEDVHALRQEIMESEESGMSDDTLEDIWEEAKAQHHDSKL